MWNLLLAAIMSSCIAPPSHCLPIDTVWGDGVAEPFDGEDWCIGTPLERWDNDELYNIISFTQNTTLEAQCGDFGGRLVVIPDEPSSDPQTMQSVSERFDMRGMDVSFRLAPIEASNAGAHGYVDILGPFGGLGGDPFIRIEYGVDTDYIDFFIASFAKGDTTDEYLRVNGYEPDGDHAWWRFKHDPDTDTFTLYTSPTCGNWTPRLSGTVSSEAMRSMWWVWYSDVTQPDDDGPRTGVIPGYLGQMWACEPAVPTES